MYKVFLFIFVLVSIIYGQMINDKVAVVGKREITKDEFKERFELTPHIGVHRDSLLEQHKQQFLYTLIAEKLWAQKAQELSYDTISFLQSTFNYLEKIYSRDALYKIEVKDKALITDQDFIRAYAKYRYTLKVDFISRDDEQEIKVIHNFLQKGYPFDSLMTKSDSSLTVTFGQMIESIEDSLYKLNPGQFTYPISTPVGWYIFKIKDKILTEMSPNDESQSKVKKIITNRKTDKAYQEFYKKFFVKIEIRTDGKIFHSLAAKLINIFVERSKVENHNDSDKIYLSDNDFRKIRSEFGDTLNLPYIHIDNKPVTLNEFLSDIQYSGFYVTSSEPNLIRNKLNSTVRTYIEQELLAREAQKRDLKNLPEVKQSLQMWKDYYRCQLLRRHFLDSARVTESEIQKSYKDDNKGVTTPKMVNIVEVLTDSLEVIEKVLDEIKNNVDIKEIAAKYTKREWTKNNKGEFGFFPVTEHGEIGKIASTMEVGEVYGPLKVPEGYSIFKLIDKRDEQQQPLKPFEELKDDIKKNLMAQKLEDKIIHYTVKLANEYGVSINEDLLKNIKVTNIMMFAYRYMGFGGRLIAVPLSAPFYEWTEPWQQSKSDLP